MKKGPNERQNQQNKKMCYLQYDMSGKRKNNCVWNIIMEFQEKSTQFDFLCVWAL